VSKLPRQVALFGYVSLLNDFASEMVYPLIPAFMTQVLGAGALALGTLDGLADLAAAGVKFASGWFSDRPRRRGALIVLGYVIAVVVRPVIAVTAAAWQVIGLRVVDRVGKGVRGPPRDALIAEVTPPALVGRAFGQQRGMDHAGAVLGPLVAWGLLTATGTNLRGIIGASIVPGVLVVVLAVLAVGKAAVGKPAVGRAAVDTTAVKEAAVRSGDRLTAGSSTALLFISIFSLLRMPETLVILRAQELRVSVSSVLLLWAALHVVRSSSSFVGGRLSDRLGPARTMWMGWAAYALIAAGFAVARGPGPAWALFLALGLVAGLTESPERALVARGSDGRQGRGFGGYHGWTGLASLGGGLALGGLFQAWGAPLAFGVSAAAGGLLVLVWPTATGGQRSGGQ
jgi:MFS family permease